MLKKFLTIKHVGKFRDYSAAGDTELARLTLILADNGRGKTTAGDILRSLKTGNPAHVLGRATLGSNGNPEISLRFDTGNIVFKDGKWSQAYPDISIYDTAFVHENVFAGDCVDHTHKKNLYSVIVGEDGVKLARSVEDLDNKLKDAQRDITTKKSELERGIPAGLPLQTFLRLSKDEAVDANIAAMEQVIRALQSAEEIKSKPELKKILLPVFPATFLALMQKSLPNVTRDVEARVRAHLAEHTSGATEQWVGDGVSRIKNDTCPFCSQPIEGNTLIAAYTIFFGEAYRALKREIDEQQEAIEAAFSRRNLLDLQRTVSGNGELASFWKQFITFEEAAISFQNDIERAFELMRSTAVSVATQKRSNPLESIDGGIEFAVSCEGWKAAQEAVARYNAAIDVANSQITLKRTATAQANIKAVSANLVTLRLTKQRYEPAVDEMCLAYQAAVTAKERLEAQKTAAKAALDSYSERVFSAHEREINQTLTKFGAGFRLADAKRSYLGGTPSTTYQLMINGHSVDLGDGTTPVNKPSFRNTLSAGDKNTLALAFFLAQIEHDSRRGEKIVIFDDPFTSQDQFRRTCTHQMINRLAGIVRQVIVFSHDPGFLKSMWDNAGTVAAKVLQFARCGSETVTINVCDIDAETKSVYLRNHSKMLAFSRECKGDATDVVKCIRPFLEGWFRLRYPGNFSETEWLGDFIKRIREADTTSPLYAAKGMLDELTAINDYSKKYHHEQTPGSDAEPLNEAELLTFVSRTLALAAN